MGRRRVEEEVALAVNTSEVSQVVYSIDFSQRVRTEKVFHE